MNFKDDAVFPFIFLFSFRVFRKNLYWDRLWRLATRDKLLFNGSLIMEKTILVDLLLSSRTQCKLVSFSKQVCTRRPSSFNEKIKLVWCWTYIAQLASSSRENEKRNNRLWTLFFRLMPATGQRREKNLRNFFLLRLLITFSISSVADPQMESFHVSWRVIWKHVLINVKIETIGLSLRLDRRRSVLWRDHFVSILW